MEEIEKEKRREVCVVCDAGEEEILTERLVS